jgi:hypothetical protein
MPKSNFSKDFPIMIINCARLAETNGRLEEVEQNAMRLRKHTEELQSQLETASGSQRTFDGRLSHAQNVRPRRALRTSVLTE